ncbi:MAG: AAA family ATPase, partial [Longimicrobiales bacterium]
MHLLELELTNFRQHAGSHIRFRPGVTGIVGPNGAGKSTILEAIAWAIYGAAAARGTNDTIRFQLAARRSRVEVSLAFELAGHEYRVTRTLNDAEVEVDGGGTPVAGGVAGTSQYLQARLGMDRQEFFNTYFTGQKELQFLANMGPTQRARFLNRLLGYERLRVAQDRARTRRIALRHELDGLRAGLGDPILLEKSLETATTRLAGISEESEQAELERKRAADAQREIVPRWAEAQKIRERARDNVHETQAAKKELEAAERDSERTRRELETIAEAAAELGGVRERLRELPAIVAEVTKLDELARVHERRSVLAHSETALREEIAERDRRIATLEKAPGLVMQFQAELAAAREALETADSQVEAQSADWSSKKQEVATRLQSARERARELKQKIRELKKAGPDGTCPTCLQPLHGEFETVLGRFDDELLTLTQDGKWLSKREKQLARKPATLVEAERARERARAAADEQGQKLARCEQAVQELWTVAESRKRDEKRLATLRMELAALPAGYDSAQHAATQSKLDALRNLERRAERLTSIVEAKAEREAQSADAQKLAAAARHRIAALARESGALGYSDEQFEKTRAEHDAAADSLHRAELFAVEITGRVQTAEEARRLAVRDLKQYRDRMAGTRNAEFMLRHHNDLDSALTRLREDLNARVRPELSMVASTFLAEITDGRYTALDIDDDYNVLVLDEGEEKPVISGGEEDIANLVLRLAISQMIAERAGQQLSILILDEIFGSLDVEHRDNVIQLLHKLEARFEQVILITHVEGIREGLDNVLRVRYDERTGSSIVTEESVRGTLQMPT